LVISVNIVRATFSLVLVEKLKGVCTSEAEQVLFNSIARDLKRHIAYGVGHVNFYLSRQPQLHDQVHAWLGRAELLLVADQRRDQPLNEALILLLGNTADEGREALREMRRTWLALYLNRLADARVVDRIGKLAPELEGFLPEGAVTPSTVSMRPPMPDPSFA
jgi:hypothetical protein